MILQEWQREQILREIDFTAVRSRGPGGQNVNKVSSAAVLYWCPVTSAALLQDQRQRLMARLGATLNKDEFLMMRSDEYRDLPMNKSRCIEKLFALLEATLHVPKKRRATKPSRSSREKKMDSKTKRGDVKRLRGRIRYDGD